MQLAISEQTVKVINAGVILLLILFWTYLIKLAFDEQKKKREVFERLVTVLEKLDKKLGGGKGWD